MSILTAPNRRIARFRLGGESLLSLLKSLSNGETPYRCEGLPADARFVAIAPAGFGHELWVYVESEEFYPIVEFAEPPMLPLIFVRDEIAEEAMP